MRKGELWRITLLIMLIGILVVIFLFQRPYFVQELNGYVFGTAFLITMLFFEFVSHFAFWRTPSKASRWFFGVVSFILIFCSVFVNFSVLLDRSEQYEQKTKHKRELHELERSKEKSIKVNAEKEIKEIDNLISLKLGLIQKYREKNQLWRIPKTEKKIEKLRTEKKDIISSLSNQKQTAVIESFTILENFERKTGLSNKIISTLTKLFAATLLGVIPFSICYLLASPVAPPPPAPKPNNDDKEEPLVPAALDTPIEEKVVIRTHTLFETAYKLFSPEEIAHKLKISVNYLKQLEGKKNLPEGIENNLRTLVV